MDSNFDLDYQDRSIKIILEISNISLIKMIRSNELKFITVLFIAAFLITWLVPLSVIFAQEDEEILLKELTGEEEVTAEVGKIEVLGITEEQMPLLGNKFLVVVVALIVAAVGGLVLSFVIRGRT